MAVRRSLLVPLAWVACVSLSACGGAKKDAVKAPETDPWSDYKGTYAAGGAEPKSSGGSGSGSSSGAGAGARGSAGSGSTTTSGAGAGSDAAQTEDELAETPKKPKKKKGAAPKKKAGKKKGAAAPAAP